MLLPHLLTHILQQDAVSYEALSTVAHLTPNMACRRPGDAFGGKQKLAKTSAEMDSPLGASL